MAPNARLFAALLVLFLCGSCHKTEIAGACTGNCKTVHFTGIAYDPGAQKPLANLAVRVDMSGRPPCLYCSVSYQVAAGNTKADGTFDLTATVDSSLVGIRTCNISVQGPANYITYAEPLGSEIATSSKRAMLLFVDSTGTAPYQEYDFYSPIHLSLHLHRTAGFVPSRAFLSLNFILGASSASGWILNETPSNADTTITVNTGANVFTRINYVQSLTDSTTVNLTDSIRCVPGGNNNFEIDYP